MSNRQLTWEVDHAVIDGVIIDRENGWPDLELEMHPVGTALLPEQQSRELHVKIGKAKTVIDAEGIIFLIDFLINSHRP